MVDLHSRQPAACNGETEAVPAVEAPHITEFAYHSRKPTEAMFPPASGMLDEKTM